MSAAALAGGAAVAWGLLLVAAGLRPRAVPLARLAADLRRPWAPPALAAGARGGGTPAGGAAPPPSSFAASSAGVVSRVLARGAAGAPFGTAGGRRGRSTAENLAVVGRTAEEHLALKGALGVGGTVLVAATAAFLALLGFALPWAAVALGALGAGVAGFVVPDAILAGEAAERRDGFRHALSTYLDLVVIAMAGGDSPEAALRVAATVGDDPFFGRLRLAVEAARWGGTTVWDSLGALGAELGLAELAEVAATVALGGTEGARMRQSLETKARTLRAHLRTEAKAEAKAASQRMVYPLVLLGLGFTLFLAFPAVYLLLESL